MNGNYKRNCVLMPVVTWILWAGISRGQEIQVMVPELGTEGNGLLNVSANAGFHYEILYPGSLFADLPATHRTIAGVYLRPDASVTEPMMANYDDIRLTYSITTKTPAELTSNLSANHGSNPVTVLDGPVTVSTLADGAPGGPHGYDFYFPFDTPFEFDPSAGNLLTEVSSVSGPDQAIVFDTVEGFAFEEYGASYTAAGGLDSLGFAVAFAVVPETNGAWLMLLGVCAIVPSMRRCRRLRSRRV